MRALDPGSYEYRAHNRVYNVKCKNIVVPHLCFGLYDLREIDRARLSFQDVGLTEPVQIFVAPYNERALHIANFSSLPHYAHM